LRYSTPDAPGGTFTHWLVYGMPPNISSLAAVPAGAAEGVNDFGRRGYGGPCPPRGAAHHYHFVVLALDTWLGLAPGATRSDLEARISGHVPSAPVRDRFIAVAVGAAVTLAGLAVTVTDDGTGLRTTGDHGNGLAIMRERAEELGGAVTVRDASPGVIVEARLPAVTAPAHVSRVPAVPA